jgi:molybdenum cofactor cytidylyltransferase
MGRDKALLPWPPVAERTPAVNTFLGATIDLLQQYSDLVIVVAGKNSPHLGPIAYAHAAYLEINATPDLGQFSSLKVGLREVLTRGRDAALIALVDRPPVVPGTVRDIRDAYQSSHTEVWAVVPEVQREGKPVHGHPVLVGREMIEAFLRAPSESNAREVEHLHQEHIRYLPVEDPRVAANVDTPEDYQRLVEANLISSEKLF